MRRRCASLVLCAMPAILLTSCGTVTHLAGNATLANSDEASANRVDGFRFVAGDNVGVDHFLDDWDADMARAGKNGVVALGFSGGGSNGAFGAGIVAGWPQADRPDFDLVTGVSTGAMLAPFAFAGPEWDEALRLAFFDPDIACLTISGLGIAWRPSLYSGVPLSDLVARHATPELVAAIARRHEMGGRLLIATANIDTLEMVVWNMGAIAVAAQDPGDDGRSIRLFRSIVVASASVPGFFPPVLLQINNRSELHVDGAVNAPIVLLPEAVATRTFAGRLRPLKLYVIVNDQASPTKHQVRGGALSIIARALTSMGRATLRAHLQLAELFARRHNASFRFAAVPATLETSPLEFEFPRMLELYEFGRTSARSGTAFTPGSF